MIIKKTIKCPLIQSGEADKVIGLRYNCANITMLLPLRVKAFLIFRIEDIMILG